MKLIGWRNVEFYSDANVPTVTYVEFSIPAKAAGTALRKVFAEIDDEKFKAYIRKIILPNIKGKKTILNIKEGNCVQSANSSQDV